MKTQLKGFLAALFFFFFFKALGGIGNAVGQRSDSSTDLQQKL